MPKQLQHSLRNAATGFGIAAIFLGGAMATDLAGMRTWVGGWQLGLVVYLVTGLVFTLVQSWLVRSDHSEPPRPPRGGKRRELIPVRVPVPVRKKRR